MSRAIRPAHGVLAGVQSAGGTRKWQATTSTTASGETGTRHGGGKTRVPGHATGRKTKGSSGIVPLAAWAADGRAARTGTAATAEGWDRTVKAGARAIGVPATNTARVAKAGTGRANPGADATGSTTVTRTRRDRQAGAADGNPGTEATSGASATGSAARMPIAAPNRTGAGTWPTGVKAPAPNGIAAIVDGEATPITARAEASATAMVRAGATRRVTAGCPKDAVAAAENGAATGRAPTIAIGAADGIAKRSEMNGT